MLNRASIIKTIVLSVIFALFNSQIALAATPTVSTNSASSVTRNMATLNGTVSDSGSSAVTQRGFEYGETVSYGQNIPATNYSFHSQIGSQGNGNGQFNWPYGIAISNDGTKLYVADPWSNSVKIMDSTTNEYISRINVESTPYGVATSPDGSKIYISLANGNTAIYNLNNNEFIDNIRLQTEVANYWDDVMNGDNPVHVYFYQWTAPTTQQINLVQPGNYDYFPAIVFLASDTPGLDGDWTGTPVAEGTYSNKMPSFQAQQGVEYTIALTGGQCSSNGRTIELAPFLTSLGVTNNGTETHTFDGSPEGCAEGNDLTSDYEPQRAPGGLAVSPDGTKLYIADGTSDTIQVFDTSNNTYVATIGTQGTGDGQFNFGEIYGRRGNLAVSPDGTKLYVGDAENNRIQVFNTSDNSYVSQFGPSVPGNGQFSNPGGLVLSPDGTKLLVADIGNNRILIFNTADNSYFDQFGSPGSGNEQFNFDWWGNGLVFSPDGNKLYISDSSNHRIQVFNTNNPLSANYRANASGLTCETEYHFRTYATNDDGTSYGEDDTFITTACPVAPTVDTGGYSILDAEELLINTVVINDGGDSEVLVGIEYGETIQYGNTETGNYAGVGYESETEIGGLNCDITYHYRSYAENSVGRSYGNDSTFSLPCPQVADLSLSGRRMTTGPIVSGMNVTYDFSVKNLGPGQSYLGDHSGFYINIPTNSNFVDSSINTPGYDYQCENSGPIQDFEGGAFGAYYDGDLIACEISSDSGLLNVNEEFTITIDLFATSDFTLGEETLRAMYFDPNGQQDPDLATVYQAITDGDPLYDVPINNVTNLVYGVNDTPGTGSANSDSDPIPDSVEDAAPGNGDGNNDGTPDSEQSNVTSLPIPSGSNTGTYVTLVVPEGSTITTTAIEQATTLATKDSAYNYPLGLISFTVTTITPGSTIPIELYYYTNQQANNFTPRKYNTTNNTYTTLSTITQTQTSLTQTTINNQTVLKLSYQLQDGGPLDQDNTANGTIVDPVGLAAASVGVPDTGIR